MSTISRHAEMDGSVRRFLMRLADNRMFWPFVATILILVFYASNLTNATYAGGDGSRIPFAIDFVNRASGVYPLWNPYKLGGIPVLADPERFTLLGYLFDVRSPYAPLFLNLMMVSLAIGHGLAAYAFARSLGLSRHSSAFFSFALTVSGAYTMSHVVGRVYAILSRILALAGASFYIRYFPLSSIQKIIPLAFIAGLLLSTIGYYALLTPCVFWFVLGAWLWWERVYRHKVPSVWSAICHSLFRSGMELCVVVLAGVLSFMSFILPLALYNHSMVINQAARVLSEELPLAGSLANVFLPIKTDGIMVMRGQVFLHGSLLLLPGLALLLSQPRKAMTSRVVPFAFIVLATLVLGLGSLPVLDKIVHLHDILPVLSHIRHFSVYGYLLTLGLLCLAFAGFEADTPNLKKALLWCVGGYVFFLLVAVADSGIDNWIFQRPLSTTVWMVVGLVLTCLAYRFRQNRAAWLTVLFIVAVVQIVLPSNVRETRIHAEEGSGLNSFMVRRSSQTLHSPLVEKLNTYQGPFRVSCAKKNACPPIGVRTAMGLEGFSYFFKPEHRQILSWLNGGEVVEARPHWVERQYACQDLRDNTIQDILLDMLNVRFIICRSQEAHAYSGLKWVGSHKSSQLYARANWHPAFKMFDRWEILAPGQMPSIEDIVQRWNGAGAALVSGMATNMGEDLYDRPVSGSAGQQKSKRHDYHVKLVRYTEDRLQFETDSNKDAILYLPEYYDEDWQTFVDGNPVQTLRVFYAFRGALVPAGSHVVEFVYRPRMAFWGVGISILSLFVLAFGALIEYRRKDHV